MDRADALIAAITEEDRLLCDQLARCPQTLREMQGSGNSLSFKDTLGHLAFWDSFAVQFFNQRLDGMVRDESERINFEERNRQELKRLRELPYVEVHELYRKATRDLLAFLRQRWHELSGKERRDIHLSLKHRRHHRVLLENAFQAYLIEGDAHEAEGKA